MLKPLVSARNNTEKSNDLNFKYVASSLIDENICIKKNLQNLQNDLFNDEIRGNYLKINRNTGKTSVPKTIVNNTGISIHNSKNKSKI